MTPRSFITMLKGGRRNQIESTLGFPLSRRSVASTIQLDAWGQQRCNLATSPFVGFIVAPIHKCLPERRLGRRTRTSATGGISLASEPNPSPGVRLLGRRSVPLLGATKANGQKLEEAACRQSG